MTVIRLYVNGEHAMSDVLNRPILDLLQASGVNPTQDFEGFATKSQGFYAAQRSAGIHWATDPLRNADTSGVTDSRGVLAAIEALGQVGVLPPGIYRIGSSITLAGRWFIYPGAILRPVVGATVTFADGAVIEAPSADFMDTSAGGAFAGTALSGDLRAAREYADAGDAALEATIAGKADAAHTHAIADVTGLQEALDAAGGGAPAAHTHPIADVEGLQTALDGKAATAHTHAIADVAGLQDALDAAGTAEHTHPISDLETTGTPDATTFLRGDGAWAAVEGGGAAEPATPSVSGTVKTVEEDPDPFVYEKTQMDQILFSVRSMIISGATTQVSSSLGFRWTGTIFCSGAPRSMSTAYGSFNINFPPNGTVITGLGVSNITVTSGYIPMPQYSALYYVPPVGTDGVNTDNTGFRIVKLDYNAPTEIPHHWIPLAVRLVSNYRTSWGVELEHTNKHTAQLGEIYPYYAAASALPNQSLNTNSSPSFAAVTATDVIGRLQRGYEKVVNISSYPGLVGTMDLQLGITFNFVMGSLNPITIAVSGLDANHFNRFRMLASTSVAGNPGRTINWPSTFRWQGAPPPAGTFAPHGVWEMVEGFTFDGGSNWFVWYTRLTTT